MIEISAGELFDVHFSVASVAITSSTNIYIYKLHEDKQPSENMLKAKNTGKKKSGKSGSKESQLESLELAHTIVKPKLPSIGSANSSFRAARSVFPLLIFLSYYVSNYMCARFHPNDFETIYAVLNTSTTTGKRRRGAYIVKYEWVMKHKAWRVVRTLKINEGSVTRFDIRQASVSAIFRDKILIFHGVYSKDGRFLAYSASDCSVGIVDAVRLSVS